MKKPQLVTALMTTISLTASATSFSEIELAGYTQGYCAQLISLERVGNQKLVKAYWKEVIAMNDSQQQFKRKFKYSSTEREVFNKAMFQAFDDIEAGAQAYTLGQCMDYAASLPTYDANMDVEKDMAETKARLEKELAELRAAAK
ncbi:hypothetical protein [Vibrio sp. 10N.261.46.A3]|uniref:hypothetical protein n=1 Tax=Vibrio sp. 10N.261.46.A3 TaxID=3229658 RepID=UPI003550E3E9